MCCTLLPRFGIVEYTATNSTWSLGSRDANQRTDSHCHVWSVSSLPNKFWWSWCALHLRMMTPLVFLGSTILHNRQLWNIRTSAGYRLISAILCVACGHVEKSVSLRITAIGLLCTSVSLQNSASRRVGSAQKSLRQCFRTWNSASAYASPKKSLISAALLFSIDSCIIYTKNALASLSSLKALSNELTGRVFIWAALRGWK